MSLVFETEEEVADLFKKEGRKVILFQGTVYDVAEYMGTHPGGEDLLADELGTNIEEKFEEAEHTKAARRIFKDLPVVGHLRLTQSTSSGEDGPVITKGGAVHMDGGQLNSKLDFDYNKGLLWQVWNTEWTFEEYYSYINDPKVLVNPIRDVKLFDNVVMEYLSRAEWWYIPLVYIPYSLYFVSLSGVALPETAALVVFGIFFWTLFEYGIHRLLFHIEDLAIFPRYQVVYTLHFLIHGIHHAFPQDRLRLVFPPALGVTLTWPIVINPIRAVFPAAWSNPIVGGVLLGYLGYDMIHYFLHHASPKQDYWRELKAYHMQHHYKDGQMGFGVSSKFWDIVFGT
jgi:4-hydroxysphinganine ceramide fatty acyl 2-hydroxylase